MMNLLLALIGVFIEEIGVIICLKLDLVNLFFKYTGVKSFRAELVVLTRSGFGGLDSETVFCCGD